MVAAQLPGHRVHPRPAARGRVPVRLAGDRPAPARAADPVRGRGTVRGERIVGDWIGALVGQGLLPPGSGQPGGRPSADAFTAALYGYLARTPALLIGVNLAEAAGEIRSQNMPGTSDEYPNWKLPLCGPDGEPVMLEDLASSERVSAVARAAAGSQGTGA